MKKLIAILLLIPMIAFAGGKRYLVVFAYNTLPTADRALVKDKLQQIFRNRFPNDGELDLSATPVWHFGSITGRLLAVDRYKWELPFTAADGDTWKKASLSFPARLRFADVETVKELHELGGLPVEEPLP